VRHSPITQVLKRLRKMQREAEREQQVQQARALLQAAGYDVGALSAAGVRTHNQPHTSLTPASHQ
jgi:hypothetical protein